VLFWMAKNVSGMIYPPSKIFHWAGGEAGFRGLEAPSMPLLFGARAWCAAPPTVLTPVCIGGAPGVG
jgi:hypothetical protein